MSFLASLTGAFISGGISGSFSPASNNDGSNEPKQTAEKTANVVNSRGPGVTAEIKLIPPKPPKPIGQTGDGTKKNPWLA